MRSSWAQGLLVLALSADMAACGGKGGVRGAAVGSLPTTTAVASGDPTSGPPAGPTTSGSGPTSPSSTPVPPASTASTASPPASGLRLGGDSLGVTRVGAPFREAVAAVTATLGRPTADPATDTSCLGAEDETTWPSFRLASSGGRLSGWHSTSRLLATPDGVTSGTTLGALRQAYGARLQLPLPDPDSGPIFLVPDVRLAGTLTGSTADATVTSLSNGTCQAA